MSGSRIRKVTILGSTGSIGRQAVEVVTAHPDLFSVFGLSAGGNTELLWEQAKLLHPKVVASAAALDAHTFSAGTDVLTGEDAAAALAGMADADIVVLGISGIAALFPLLQAIRAGKRVAIANKESLVCGGELVKAALAANPSAELLPVDSEQSALFQSLQNGRRDEVSRLILTASGGPFREATWEQMRQAKADDALRHPTWRMGRKISLDSATMFNKGLEVIETARLFGVAGEQIGILVHPQSVVHGLVEYRDGTVMANLANPDMRLPIQYAMTYPDRVASPARALHLEELSQLTFFAPDTERFPAISLAYGALRRENGYPTVYNGANERAAELYFEGRIRLTDIAELVADAMDAYRGARMDSPEAVAHADAEARTLVNALAARKESNH